MTCLHLGEKIGEHGCCAGAMSTHVCTFPDQESEFCSPDNAVGYKSLVTNVKMLDGTIRRYNVVRCDQCEFLTQINTAPLPKKPSGTRERWLAVRNS